MQWRLIFMGPQCGTGFMESRVLRWLLDFWKVYAPLFRYLSSELLFTVLLAYFIQREPLVYTREY